MQGKVSGQLRVFFYDTEAGARDVGPVVVPARASPQASSSFFTACETLPASTPLRAPQAPQAASLTRASCINNSPALLGPVWVAQGEDQYTML